MDIGFVGLGTMALNMVMRLQRAGHRVTAYDRRGCARERHPCGLHRCGLTCGSRAAAQGPSLAALRKAFGGHDVKR